MQRIEGVEKFLLRTFFLRQELDVINQQHIHIAELVAEAGHLVVAQRVDHLVGELLAGDVADGRLRLPHLDFVPDRLHQMSLAHADTAIEEKRVIGLGWALRHRLAGGVGELIATTDHERVKGVTRIELGRAVPVEAGLGVE